MKENLTIGFIGNPNCGKTTLFNAYTGANLKVANWPGVTVEKVEGAIRDHNLNIRLVDLPGTYSLTSYTMEEQVSRQFILSDEVDMIIDVVDASALERNLYLTLQLLELGKPVVMALNMMDIVEKRGMEIDTHRLPEMLGIPVIPVSARKRTGLDVLLHAAAHHKDLLYSINSEDYDAKRAEFIQRLSKGEKLFVISSYNTVGAGQNLQYKAPGNATIVAVNDYDRGDMEKDFDCIYLEKPTNLLVNVDSKKGIEAEDLIRFVYQMEFLMERGEVSRKDGIAVIKDVFICFSGGYTFSGKKGEPYKTDSVNNYALRTLIQAVGRICRTGLKNPDIYIYVDNTILTDYD